MYKIKKDYNLDNLKDYGFVNWKTNNYSRDCNPQMSIVYVEPNTRILRKIVFDTGKSYNVNNFDDICDLKEILEEIEKWINI